MRLHKNSRSWHAVFSLVANVMAVTRGYTIKFSPSFTNLTEADAYGTFCALFPETNDPVPTWIHAPKLSLYPIQRTIYGYEIGTCLPMLRDQIGSRK